MSTGREEEEEEELPTPQIDLRNDRDRQAYTLIKD
jgi:hypothetical protein